MCTKSLINGLLLVIVICGLFGADPVSAQGGVQTIPIPGVLLTVKAAPDGRLVAAYELASYHTPGDLVPAFLPVRLVDLDSGTVTPLPGPADYALDVAFSPDGAILAGCYGNGQVVLWDTATAAQMKTLFLMPGINRCTFFPDGRTLAVAAPVSSTLSAFLLLDTDSGTITRILSYRFDTHAQFWNILGDSRAYSPYALAAATITPDGSRIITSSMNDSLWLWDTAGEPPALLFESVEEMPTVSIRKLAVTSDSATLVYLNTHDPAVHAWDLASAAETVLIPLEERPFDFALAPDGDRVALAYRESGALTLTSLSQPDASTSIDLALPEGVSLTFPVVAFATSSRIVVTGQLAEGTGDNALYVLDLP